MQERDELRALKRAINMSRERNEKKKNKYAYGKERKKKKRKRNVKKDMKWMNQVKDN
jgi:hypothetical protein